MTTDSALKSMPLYVNVERIHSELTELGIGGDATLQPEQLFPFDQYHYNGVNAVRAAVEAIGIGSSTHVLEIGSGLGGPARYLAHTTGCRVTALELQDRLHAVAVTLTERCGLSDRVEHVCADALTYPLPDAHFDAVVSWLAIHHISERLRLLSRCYRAARPGGRLYIEDLCARSPFAESDLDDVQHTIVGISLSTAQHYARDVQNAGFSDISVTDMTEDWMAFCAGRADAWRREQARHLRVHGQATFATLDRFFSTVLRLFRSGSLGGIRLTARRA